MLETSRRRGNYFLGLAILVVIGFGAVIGIGAMNVGALGLVSAETAMVMAGTSIAILGVTTVVSLVALKRTLTTLGRHEVALVAQAERHTQLVAELQDKMRQEQTTRDRQQDARIAELNDRFSVVSLKPKRPTPPSMPMEPFGQIHPVKDVEGIGASYANRLNSMGIHDTAQLWRADANYVAGRIGATTGRVEEWQAMCELMAVNGIGKQYAELLVRAGIKTIEKLSREDPKKLAAHLMRAENRREHRIQGNTITPRIAEHWVDAAAHHRGHASTNRGAMHVRSR